MFNGCYMLQRYMTSQHVQHYSTGRWSTCNIAVVLKHDDGTWWYYTLAVCSTTGVPSLISGN